MSDAVNQAWEDDGRTRRPITLQSGDAFSSEQDALVDDNETGVVNE